MINISQLTGEAYETEDYCFFRNLHQSCFYIKHHCMPVDMFCDSNDKLVMVFPRSRHKELIKLWVDNKAKKADSDSEKP